MPKSSCLGALGVPGLSAYIGLLSVCKATAGEIAAAVAASIAVQNEKFAEAKEIAERDVAAIQSNIELLRKQYPSWVK